jgi:hypothetical protein
MTGDTLNRRTERDTASPKNLHFVIVFSHAQVKECKKNKLILAAG